MGQAWSGGFFITTKGVGAPSQIFLRDGSTPVQGNLGVNNDKGVPALASASEGYVGRGDALVRFSPAALDAGTAITQVTGDVVRTSPVLGAQRMGASTREAYAVSQAGTLIAFSHGGSSSTLLWRTPVTLPGENVNTHPTLDCNRSRPASGTGILYFGSSTGFVYAVVVDSPKLFEGNGAWPKYQRTAGNAGNADMTFPVNWPGCP
ncbi:MAG: PQQ-binding-like beta-propeller repeat protein [Archangium sp.]|nr:PQQ-binding-like beta-propeller repeat protein [Archangium sp.]